MRHRFTITGEVVETATRRALVPGLAEAWDGPDILSAMTYGALTAVEVERHELVAEGHSRGQGDLGNVKAGGGAQA